MLLLLSLLHCQTRPQNHLHLGAVRHTFDVSLPVLLRCCLREVPDRYRVLNVEKEEWSICERHVGVGLDESTSFGSPQNSKSSKFLSRLYHNVPVRLFVWPQCEVRHTTGRYPYRALRTVLRTPIGCDRRCSALLGSFLTFRISCSGTAWM
jgi:hypothetical protein